MEDQKEDYGIIRALSRHVRIPGLAPHQVYFGEDYQTSPEPWALKLQQDGAPFSWVAYSFGDIPMWRLHAGIVLAQGVVRVGFHCHKDAAGEYGPVLHRVGGGLGQFRDSEAARELQYNRDYTDYTESHYPEVGQALSDIYQAARAELERSGLAPGR
ncbi:hypothetical protein CDEF62S_05697 [Castellaniella defragrans]